MRKNWYYVGGGLFIVVGVILLALWARMPVPQRLLLMSFMALLVHQFEEYAWPGGFPAVMNIAWRPNGDKPDRYPLNRQAALFVNVVFAYPYYIVPIVFPKLIWMGLGQVVFGMAQFVIHGIVINKKMRSIYNPGLFAVVFLHFPIGIYYIWYICANQLVHWWTWPAAAAWLIGGAFLGVFMPINGWFTQKNSRYPFSPGEMARFHVQEKMEKRR
jgi:Protein of unknown function with HXXEE motif